MLTKKDKQYLQQTFATKDDIKDFAKQKDLLDVKKDVQVLKKDVQVLKKDVKDIKHEMTTFVAPAIGNILQWTDDVHSAVVGKKSAKQPSEN